MKVEAMTLLADEFEYLMGKRGVSFFRKLKYSRRSLVSLINQVGAKYRQYGLE
jgi:hypothetical protein